ncbi:HSF-type DNA-binding domain containing protein [Amanita muscaria]
MMDQHLAWNINLPPPSQLNLTDNHFPASNTLPPIAQQLNLWDEATIKCESSMLHHKETTPPAFANSDDQMPSTSDFVKKLYKMLEDAAFHHVVSWGPQGDCFVVKDMNEFTKSILPRMFKHSNFASFVRQLNKYDFHKVKNTDDNQFGEHSWTFRHPDFHANRKDALENIKRKVPTSRKSHPSASSSSTTTRPLSPSPHYSSPHHHLHSSPYPQPNCVQTQVHVDSLQSEIRRLREEGDDMRTRLRTLERNYESVLLELVSFQRGMAQQDGVMQNLLGYYMGSESTGEYCSSSPSSPSGNASCAGVSGRFTTRFLTAADAPVGTAALGPTSFGVHGGNGGFNTFSAVGIMGRGVFLQ